MSNVKRTPSYWLRSASVLLGAYALLGGALSLLGWAIDVPRLAGWEGNSLLTLPNTAVAAMLAGAAFLFLNGGLRWVSAFLAIVVTLIGASVLFENWTGIDLGIDTILMFDRSWGAGGVVSPGRMGPPSALSWTLVGIAMLLVAISGSFVDPKRRRFKLTAIVVGLAALSVASLSIIGYLYGARTLYALPHLTAIAFQTSTFILAVAAAIILFLTETGPLKVLADEGPAGLLARRVAPAIVVLPLLLGFIRLMGEQAGYYDLAFGTAARTMIEIVLLLVLLIWAANTVRKQASLTADREVAAERSERNFQQMAEAMPQVVWIADNTGHIHYYNQRVSNFAGVVRFPDDSFDWRPVIHPDDLEETVSCWQEAVEKKNNYGIEHRILTADGTYHWHLSRAVPVLDADGQVEKWYGTATDIDDLKLAEKELQQVNDELENRVHVRTQELAEANRSLVTQMEERRIAETEKLHLMRRLVNSQEIERARIARDMHDQLGQRLTALRLKIESLKDIAAGDEILTERVNRLQEIGELLDSEVSFIAWELRPTALDDLGLAQALETYVDEWSRHYDISAEFHSSGIAGSHRTETKTHLYRIAQEALNNIAKYAKADNVTVMLERRDAGIVMIVEDDGIGFDVPKETGPNRLNKGLGILGMNERAALINGDVEIESSPGSGTTVFVRVPVLVNSDPGFHISIEPSNAETV